MTEENNSPAAVVETAPVTSEPSVSVAPIVEPVLEQAPKETTLLTENVEPAIEAQPTAEPIKVEDKVSDSTVVEPVKTEEQIQSDEPASIPSYDTFKLPEGVMADPESLGAFTNILTELDGAKTDSVLRQASAQKLVDMHVAEVQKTLSRAAQVQAESFEKVKQEWRQAFVNDPDIGGNRQETTLTAARQVITNHGGTVEQQAEFRNILDKTGLGNHPAVIRFLANVGQAYREPKPLPATVPVKEKTSKTQTLYGKAG